MFSTPILFLIFNRPQTTEKVFEEIRKQKPKHLFISADGPRENNQHDVELCKTTRNIVSKIDWECEVKTLFSDKNMGCGLAPATGMTWFFEQVEEGIILEDDCIPNSSFFDYCETLLNKYRDNTNIMMVCGTSYQPKPLNNDTYYFSKYPHVWGWATWKRAWKNYSFKLDGETNETRRDVIERTFTNNRERKFWENNMRMIINGLDAWDYQFMYWMWKNNGTCIVPWQNMISNIGFGAHATHTHDSNSNQSQMVQHQLSIIKHPQHIKVNTKADDYERGHILIGTEYKYYLNRLRAVAGRFIKPILIKNGR